MINHPDGTLLIKTPYYLVPIIMYCQSIAGVRHVDVGGTFLLAKLTSSRSCAPPIFFYYFYLVVFFFLDILVGLVQANLPR